MRTAFAMALLATCSWLSVAKASDDLIQLNQNAIRLAQQLIDGSYLIADKNGAWQGHKPSAEDENAYLRLHGWSEYAKWHLGIDPRHRENSKARYKFPFGDFKNVHRCALIAIRSRAGQYHHSEIEKVAAELQRKLEAQAKPAK